MSFAFSALVLLLIYLPGAIYLFTYWGRLSKDSQLPVLSATLSGQVIKALIWACLLQALWLCLGMKMNEWGISSTVPHPQIFLTLLGSTDAKELQTALNWLSNNLWPVFRYFASLYVFAAVAGYLVHLTVRKSELDRKYQFWRFTNNWHYLLEDGIKPQYRKNLIVYIHAVMEIAGNPIIYGGVLRRYWYDATGELDSLILVSATRTLMKPGNMVAEKAEPLPGNVLHLKCSQVKNLAITYLTVPSAGTSGGSNIQKPGALSVSGRS